MEGAASFRTTHWTVVLRAAQSQAPGGPAALAELCRLYWYPLYAFVRRRGYGPEEAQDLTQGFFLHLLSRRALSHVDPLKGKFRSFLLASLQNFLLTEADRARCLKRGAKMEFVAWDAKSAEERYRLEPADDLTAEKIFDARWAMTVLTEAMRLRSAASLSAVKTLIHRLRKQHTCLLREEVTRTVGDPAEVDEEMHALCEALIASEGRLGP
jgi:DNA-directed RNA polymerase specialized sigma24 family protein